MAAATSRSTRTLNTDHGPVDTCDYSLDPDFVGRRVEIRVGDREVLGVVLDTGELACRHPS